MSKRIVSLLLTAFMLFGTLQPISVFAATENESEVIDRIDSVKTEYEPNKTFFVSHSEDLTRMVGEDNIDGDKTQGCFTPGTKNSHGRFGDLWQSNGFANYVFNTAFGNIPRYDYHCNPSEIKGNIEVVGRYATECKHDLIRGEIDGTVSLENIKALLSKAKAGDILVLAPKNRCRVTAQSMIVQEVNNAGITVYQADFTGYCAVTENTITYDAIADYHCVTLLTSTEYPLSPEEAPGTVESVKVSALDYALNENISVSWKNEKFATSYNVSIIEAESGDAVEYKNVPGNMCTFSLNYPGEFKIGVVASNSFGDSGMVYSETIKVHNYNIVKFLDHDGTLIATQNVHYGETATKPSHKPQRKGYEFNDWDKSLDTIITEPTTFTAQYDVIKYTVSYYKVGGEELISKEKVSYGEAANPPSSNLGITSGYVFAGWHIEFDDTHTCTDYNYVDSNMKLVATECWENDNLPILITPISATLQKDGKTYKIDATLKNYDKSATAFKIIATLKTSTGKVVKSIPCKELSLDKNETVSFSEEVVYSGKISTVELLAVGVVDDVKTAGAYSKVVSLGITAEIDWYWGEWSDWSTQEVTKNDETNVDTPKVQYRYRTKLYTTSVIRPNHDGWTHYNTTSSTGSWSAWQNTYVEAVNNTALKREVETRQISATYKTQYRYGAYVRSDNGGHRPCTHCSGGSTTETWTAWSDSELPIFRKPEVWYTDGYGQVYKCPHSCASHTDSVHAGIKGNFCGRGNGYYWYTYGSSTANKNHYFWKQTRQVVDTPAYTQYRYRDTNYTYYLWKYSDWSSWSDTAITETSERDVETRKLYRYQKKVYTAVSDPNAGAEDNSGSEYTVSGIIPEIEADLSGKLANFMVYKKTNLDPTEAQLQYVSQITIGAGNTYNVKFRPREEPTVDTGDFIVTLGIEGANNLVNIDVIKADIPTYTVEFIDDGGNKIGETQNVLSGESPIVPTPPEKEGHTFVQWSDNITNIQENTVVQAEYKPNEYTITFVDWEADEESDRITHIKQFYGDVIEYPALGSVTHVVNRYWDKQKEGVNTVTGNMIIQTVAEYEKYTVSFTIDGETVNSQEVEYGKAAVLPTEIPTKENMVFAYWMGPCSYNYITCDCEFSPYFTHAESVSTPVLDVKENDNGTNTVTISCDTVDSNILYAIESVDDHASLLEDEDEQNAKYIKLMSEIMGTDESDIENTIGGANGDVFLLNAQLYSGEEIVLNEGESIICVAIATGKNDSVPCIESNEPEIYYNSQISSNTLRQYRKTIEGSVTLVLKNDTSAFDKGLFTFCFYDKNGVMIKALPFSKNLNPGTNTIKFEDIVVETIEEAVTCKLISFVSGENIKPISDVIEFDIN